MKSFMLGWEFPPFISGGLGTACYGLTKAMDQLGIEVTFVLPKAGQSHQSGNIRLLSAESGPTVKSLKNVKFRIISSTLKPYVSSGKYSHHEKTISHVHSGHFSNPGIRENYTGDLYAEVQRYAGKAVDVASIEEFDIIHAHDWMTYPAGIAVAQATGKPLLVQVHSTEFDRSGENVNQVVYDIERQGMHAAAKIIAVSNYTKNIIVNHYGIAPEKVEVVYNAVEHTPFTIHVPQEKREKIVLFLGRITMQKGPEYFLFAAKKVLEVFSRVKFIMAGSGDMMHRIIELSAKLGIGKKVLFSGFLRGADVDRMYQMADLYVMPSVSEPFGIAPLEALKNRVPVIVSKQSGISEVLANALKVDFWDINEMANKIIAVLKYPPLQKTLCENGYCESHKFRWEDSAAKVSRIYQQILTPA